MAFGIDQTKIDEMMQEMSSMSSEELQSFMDDMKEKTDSIPDGHLVKYMDECRKESFEASKDRRKLDELLWLAHETEAPGMAEKEEWQSSIVLNKPFTTTIQAKALVRKGLLDSPDYFQLGPQDSDNPVHKLKVKFWDKGLNYWAQTRGVQVPYTYSDAMEMGFAVGQSMAVKVLWEPDYNGVWGLKLDMIEPWKTFPDPDRKPRQPWSGLYNIHEEWIDMHVLRDKELQGYYKNIDQVKEGGKSEDSQGYGIDDKDKERRKKGMTFARNSFRKAVLVDEFWGTILDENGDIAMPSARFTVANGVVIRGASKNPFPRLKWPWVDISPLPHLLKFHGYGLYESVLAIWRFQNTLLDLYLDNENWRINNMFEVDTSKLADSKDLEVYPLKLWLKRIGSEGQAITPVLKGESNLADVSFMWNLATNLWENGSFVTELLKGEAGSRRDITATEVNLKTQQSLGVFDSIGKDVEQGLVDLLWAMKEVLTTFWDDFDMPSMNMIIGDNDIYKTMMAMKLLSPQERIQEMAVDCSISVRGVSKLFEQATFLQKIDKLIMIGANPAYDQYIKHYEVIKAIANETNVPTLVKSEKEVMADQVAAQKQSTNAGIQGAIQHALSVAGAQGQNNPATGGANGRPNGGNPGGNQPVQGA